jgi:hypothetical protein
MPQSAYPSDGGIPAPLTGPWMAMLAIQILRRWSHHDPNAHRPAYCHVDERRHVLTSEQAAALARTGTATGLCGHTIDQRVPTTIAACPVRWCLACLLDEEKPLL